MFIFFQIQKLPEKQSKLVIKKYVINIVDIRNRTGGKNLARNLSFLLAHLVQEGRAREALEGKPAWFLPHSLQMGTLPCCKGWLQKLYFHLALVQGPKFFQCILLWAFPYYLKLRKETGAGLKLPIILKSGNWGNINKFLVIVPHPLSIPAVY